MSETLQTAYELASLGWYVFPCRSKPEKIGDKTYAAKTPYTVHGFHEATLDVDQLEARSG